MIRRAPLWLLFFLIFAGCSPISRNSLEEEKDPYFMEGTRRLNAMDEDGAIKSFKKALQSNPNNSAAHFRLGLLYEKKGDWAAALYHYQTHLQLRENSPMGEVVTNRMTACKRELASSVSFAVVTRDVQAQLEKLNHTNSLLQRRVLQLESELTRRPLYVTNYVTNFVSMPQFSPKDRSPTRSTEIVRTESGQSEPVALNAPPSRETKERRTTTPAGRTSRPATEKREKRETAAASKPGGSHVVRPGETLKFIAAKYGIPADELIAANPGTGRGVRAGQKLVIPAK